MQSFLNPSAITIMGLSTTTSAALEADPATAKIAPLWARFFSENVESKIPARMKPHRLYAAYTEYTDEDRGTYTIVVGAQTSTPLASVEGLTVHTIPHGSYQEFVATGPMPDGLLRAWTTTVAEFFKTSAVRRDYSTDFEVHNKLHPEEISLYIRCR